MELEESLGVFVLCRKGKGETREWEGYWPIVINVLYEGLVAESQGTSFHVVGFCLTVQVFGIFLNSFNKRIEHQ